DDTVGCLGPSNPAGRGRPALHQQRWVVTLVLDSALVSAGDTHVLAVLGDGAARDLDALRLQDACDLLVGERLGAVFFFDQLFNAALQNQKRGVAAFRTIYAFTEEVAQLEHTLGRVRVFIGHGAADRRRMHAN